MAKVNLTCKTAFKLNVGGDAGLVSYGVGDNVEIDTDAPYFWYAKAHCAESKKEMEKQNQRDPVKDAAATKELLKSLITEENPTPNMKDVNKALKEADLPEFENAAARDVVIDQIKAEATPPANQ